METKLPLFNKVTLSLELFDIQPTYHVLTNMWLEYKTTHKRTKEIDEFIFGRYQLLLSDSHHMLADSMEYSLYFEIFEEPTINREAWQFFLRNNPTEYFVKTILFNSGPVPFDLKFELYSILLSKKDFHIPIFGSIMHSCFDNCGNVDKSKALATLRQLELPETPIDTSPRQMHYTFEEVRNYLENKNGR